MVPWQWEIEKNSYHHTQPAWGNQWMLTHCPSRRVPPCQQCARVIAATWVSYEPAMTLPIRPLRVQPITRCIAALQWWAIFLQFRSHWRTVPISAKVNSRSPTRLTSNKSSVRTKVVLLPSKRIVSSVFETMILWVGSAREHRESRYPSLIPVPIWASWNLGRFTSKSGIV